jgi:hypothetical protein
MKTQNKPAAHKLSVKFDKELKTLLSKDLKLFMAKNPFLVTNKQAAAEQPLAVA